jgi:enterochelin esterase-like enzyme
MAQIAELPNRKGETSMNSIVTKRILITALIILVAPVGLSLNTIRAKEVPFSEETSTPPSEALLSPRLIALQKDLKAGQGAALESFWQEVIKQGTPMVEPTPDKHNFLYVTFLWRGKEDTKNVVVITLDQSQLANARFFAQSRLARLPDSDVWYRTYRLRNDARFSYRISPNDALTLLPDLNPEEQAKRLSTLQADPLNPHHYQSRNGDASVVELPKAPPQAWIKRLPGVLTGKVEAVKFKSKILNNERPVWIYTPPGYKSTGKPYHLLVTFDGETYRDSVPTPTILDNLLARRQLPPVVAVMIGNAPGARLRELWYSESFNECLVKELLPWVKRQYHVTADPKQTVVAGLSLGGGASLYAGFRHPEIFGNVISQSGGNMYRQTREEMFPALQKGQLFQDEGFPESEWLTRQIATKPKAAMRVYLEAGLLEDLEWQGDLARFAHPSLILATRHLRDVLQAKGYRLFYNEYNGGHETLSWRGSLADGLIALIGKASANGH